MSKLSFLNPVTTRASRQILVMQKHSPRLLFIAGVAGVGATVVLACRATLHLEEVLTEAEKDVQAAKETLTFDSGRSQRREMARVYVKNTGEICKLYAPAAIVGVASIAALTGSHNILSKRNAGLSAAYAASEKAFQDYRKRVMDELGEDKDREFRFGTQEVTKIVEDKNGPKKQKVTIAGGPSQYSYFWGRDTANGCWDHRPEYNAVFLKSRERWVNDRLQARGHVFLNDVLDELGLERTPQGSQVGWVLNNPNGGDNFISFGLTDQADMRGFVDFMRGANEDVLLDFNVDGEIWRLI